LLLLTIGILLGVGILFALTYKSILREKDIP